MTASSDAPDPQAGTGGDPAQFGLIDLPHGDAAVFCARSPLKRTPNEDAAVVIEVDDDRAILAVADGMGGQPDGDQASEIALETVTRVVREAGPGTNLRVAVLDGFDAANQAVMQATAGGGTTLAVVEIADGIARPYHVGDSVILIVGQRGRMRLQTVAHSPVGYAVESGLLEAADAMHHADRHIISNFVGTPEMRIEIGPPVSLQQCDTVVLGSDGLFDNLHTEEVVEIVRKGPLSEAVGALAESSLARMTKPRPDQPSKADDLTFILYRTATNRRP